MQDELRFMKPWTKWTDDEHARLAEMARQGCSVDEIAAELDRIPGVVRIKKRQLGPLDSIYASWCAACGGALTHTYRGRPKQYCTPACRESAVSARARQKRARRIAARVEWSCAICGGPLPDGSLVHRIYCSKACGSRAWYLRARAAGTTPFQRQQAARATSQR